MANNPLIPDDAPSIDRAETAVGHPHTLGVEYTDDEILIGDAEFGEAPDIETYEDEDRVEESPSPA